MRKVFTTLIVGLIGTAWLVGPAVAADTTDKADQAQGKTESATEKVKEKAETAKEKASSAMDTVKEKARETKEKIAAKLHRGGKTTASAGTDPDVRAAQQALMDKGQDPGPIDGRMGPKTQAALRGFQQAEGLQVTGMLDDATKDKLGIRGGSALPRETGTGATTAPPGATPKPERKQNE
jgi:peptidoglycan hydrolase-like protein with peptidoglycan-binding domain